MMIIFDKLKLGRMFRMPQSVHERVKTVDTTQSREAREAAERRMFRRVKSYNLLKYAMKTGDENNWISNLKDISEGGFQFNALNQVENSAILKVSINLGEFNRQVDALAKAVWVKTENVRGSVIHRVGAAFVNIRENDRLLIRDLAYC